MNLMREKEREGGGEGGRGCFLFILVYMMSFIRKYMVEKSVVSSVCCFCYIWNEFDRVVKMGLMVLNCDKNEFKW